MDKSEFIVDFNEPILITGSGGFIGSRVVRTLLDYGFTNLRCFVRRSSELTALNKVIEDYKNAKIAMVRGNLLSREDCRKATEGVSIIIHLAAVAEKSFSGCFMNCVVTSKNLLESVLPNSIPKRFLNVSSIAVYSNRKIKRGGLLDETCEVERDLVKRGEPYVFAKAKQDEIVVEYGKKYNIPYVIVRPGVVYGPGKSQITGRIGINTFGFFLHLGGSNRIPLSYVDNCAEAIVLAGLKKGVDGEVFNIVDDDLPRSRQFLKMYKRKVKYFKSIYIPYSVCYLLCFLWERYSERTKGKLPPVFNRLNCSAYWKGNQYSNDKLKNLLGWKPKVSLQEVSDSYCEYLRKSGDKHA